MECALAVGEECVEVSAEDDSESGKRSTLRMLDPKRPRQDEVDEHNITHLPYRNWCRHCVRGRGKEAAHKKGDQIIEMPEVHMDFAFMGEENEPGQTMPVLVVKERGTKMGMSSAVPSKSTGCFIAKRVLAFLKEIGCESGGLTVKSDQEAAVKAIVEEIGRLRAAGGGGRYVVENSPVGASQSNGVVERHIQTIEQLVRVLKDASEERWNTLEHED